MMDRKGKKGRAAMRGILELRAMLELKVIQEGLKEHQVIKENWEIFLIMIMIIV